MVFNRITGGLVDRAKTLLFVGALFFFMVIGAFPWLTGFERVVGYDSPDESANSFFSRYYATYGRLTMSEPLNSSVNNSLHPRSVTVNLRGELVPGGFIGLPVLYGVFAGFTSIRFIDYFTPFLAATAVVFLVALWALVWPRRVALIAGWLTMLHPAWWYYAGRGLYPNVPFLSLVITAFYFLTAATVERRVVNIVKALAGGLFLGLAVAIRPVESWWLALIIIILLTVYRRALDWRRIGFGALSFVVTLLPFLALNYLTYGSWWRVGYLTSGAERVELADRLSGFTGSFVLWDNIVNYYFGLFWWLTVPAALGLVYVLVSRRQTGEPFGLARRSYLWIFAAVSVSVLIFYGWWRINDSLVDNVVSVGQSYARYFLPAYILMMPFAALIIQSLWEARRRTVTLLISLGIVFLSFFTVFYHGEAGFLQVAEVISRNNDLRSTVLAYTEESAVILVDHQDKFLWPARRVVVDWRAPVVLSQIRNLLPATPVYLYGHRGQGEADALKALLQPYDLILSDVYPLSGDDVLWRVFEHKPDSLKIDEPTVEEVVPLIFIDEPRATPVSSAVDAKELYGTQAPETVDMNKPVPLAKESDILPLNLVSAVPFTSQAPYADWSLPYKEACEEASAIMANAYFANSDLTPAFVKQQIDDLVSWQTKRFGYYKDTTAAETVIILREYFGLDAELSFEVTAVNIKQRLSEGKLIIVPTHGITLANPYYQPPGPEYHMVVIRGYNAEEFIVNDPGTRRGDAWHYQIEHFLRAVHDFNGGDVINGQKVMIVVSPKS